MIRLREKITKYPNKTVLEDTITRSGPPTDSSFTPFRGCADIIKSQFKGTIQEYKFDEQEFIRFKDMYDFNPRKRMATMQSGMLVHSSSGYYPFKTLDDVVNMNGEAVFRKWVEEECVSYKMYAGTNYSNYRPTTMTYSDEDGKQTDEKELVVMYDKDKLKHQNKDINIQKLHYYVRLIWNYSCMYKANLFGFIYAWMDITINKRKPLVPQSFNGNYIYIRIKNTGEFHRYFSYEADIRDATFKAVMELFLNPSNHPAEYNAFKEFSKLIRALDVDFANEDPRDITKEVVDNLKCTYLPSFKEYTIQYADLDVEINYAIKSANLFTTKKIDIYKDANLSIEQNNDNVFLKTASDRIKMLYEAAKFHIKNGNTSHRVVKLFEPTREDVIKLVNAYAKKAYGIDVDLSSQLDLDSDVFIHINGKPLHEKGIPFGRFSGYTDYYVYFTIYGFVVVDTGNAVNLQVASYDVAMQKLGEENVTKAGTNWFPF